MGKKKGGSALGKALIKDSQQKNRNRGQHSARHTTALNDGYDWNKINLRSVTEDSQLDDFLATAEMAGTEFTAEKRNITLITPRSNIGVLNAEERKTVAQLQKDNIKYLRIPRRPRWDRTTTPEELEEMERESFLDWRRWLASAQEIENLVLTPYEKNLEFWRQLWRVVERSDVVAQIVDARNPLLFYSEDLESYVKEMGSSKTNLLIVNKADFLTVKQRQIWAEYFKKKNIRAVFYSALEESGVTASQSEVDQDSLTDELSSGEESEDSIADDDERSGDSIPELERLNRDPSSRTGDNQTTKDSCSGRERLQEGCKDWVEGDLEDVRDASNLRLLHREELLDLFRSFHRGPTFKEGMVTIGLVGYPNVGKSSTINSLLQCKKVSVSTTPGKTKHFQTILVDPEVCLCDCPGLVMPSFVNTKGDMFIWGILPIDQIRDHIPPVNLVASLIPRHVLERTYGVTLPVPADNPTRAPVSEELLNVYGLMRGYMTQRGLPDNPRSARYILKDFVKGKLLYCQAPPSTSQQEFHTYPPPSSNRPPAPPTRFQKRILKTTTPTEEDIDAEFFNKVNIMSVHTKGSSNMMGYKRGATSATGTEQVVGKPWKKHNKRNKKEKLRRVYRHLDE